MGVSFNKTGVVIATGTSSMPVFNLVDENGNKLTDGTNYLTTGNAAENSEYIHGFMEGGTMMSIYENNMILCNEFIEW